MQVRFLLGPAGSGKTFRCLAEIRAALKAQPAGPPLILLAPKQATFQLERQLLADAELRGYSRLRILSFERLAEFVLTERRLGTPPALSEEGRVMVLRALLLRHAGQLQRFGQSARRPGFAKELSALLAELQSHGHSPARLGELSQRADLPAELRAKLHDLGILLGAYRDWLVAHQLQDANHLLETAAAALPPKGKLAIAALWMDGFAEMTPAEVDLLAAVLPHCERATLAFCLDHEPPADESWLSIWSVVGKSFRRCREQVAALLHGEPELEFLPRDPARSRFSENSALAQLEAGWAKPKPAGGTSSGSPPRLIACANPAAEALLAAREIRKFVRRGGRYREAAVLVRGLDGYQKPLERAFRRYGIPCFLDRRESVTHHPLAELTRSALRTVAFDWPHEDWFAALKAGFAPVAETEIDRLENEALARGWRGAKWRSPLVLPEPEVELGAALERLRRKVLPPFEALAEVFVAYQHRPTGGQLVAALRDFWRLSRAEETLAEWSQAAAEAAVHATVWDQMNDWLDNLARAFPETAMPLREWLPVLEAGLANLTVGVIPPALDQVLIGAIDRSRNPDLKLACVLGLNEGVFPAAPAAPPILTDDDRFHLDGRKIVLGPNLHDRLSRERYYGYIACTRPTEMLLATFAHADAAGKKLNASAFVGHLRRLFPEMTAEEFVERDGRDAEHSCDLIPPLLDGAAVTGNWAQLRQLESLQPLAARLRALGTGAENERLSAELAGKLYGPVLKTSVSRLEQFAACPFRFFIHSGLRAEERKVYELDFREQGSFQHDVLQGFHEQLAAEGRKWRDVSPTEARDRVGRIAEEMLAHYREGLLRDSAQTQFTARVLTRALQDFIQVIVGWMHTRYRFDPAAVELDFDEHGTLPAWRLELGDGRALLLRGRIDRVDLFRAPGAAETWCVVMDYKSSGKKLDPLLVECGAQLQLLSYLNVLQRLPAENALGVKQLVPAGVFYVSLRAPHAGGDSRAMLQTAAASRQEAYRHTGRFDLGALRMLDASGADRGEQFNYRLKQDGTPYANSTELLAPAEFQRQLAAVEARLREMGARIFSGEAKVDPYRKGGETPCGFCDYAPVCRIDPWTHEYRLLKKAAAEAG